MMRGFLGGIIDWSIIDIIRDYSFSLVSDDKPAWLQKYMQGIVLYRKHRIERADPWLKQMLVHRSIVTMRIEDGVLS